MDEEGKQNHRTCSSAKIMLISCEVVFCSCSGKKSFKALYFSFLPFLPFPFPSPFLFPFFPFLPSLPLYSLFFPFSEPPSFVKKVDPSYLLTPGDSARLQCKIKGSPEIQVTWFKNNKEIHESNTHRMSFVNSVAVLDILEMKVDDTGTYSCEAVNEVGSDSCTTEVVVKGLSFLLLPVTFLRKTILFFSFFFFGMVD